MDRALVIGAGIMGLSAAWALARAGMAVRILEQDHVPNPRGSSVDDHRLIRHAYGAQHGYMRMVDPAYAAWDLLFAEGGERLHVPTGVLALAGAEGGWLAASRAALGSDGHDVRDLDPSEVASRFPFLSAAGIAAAFGMQSGGVLLARRIVAMLAGLLAARGVAVERGQVSDIDPERARAKLGATWCDADLLVVAAGPWTPRLVPGLAARVRPTRQIIVRLEPPRPWAEAWARAPMVLDLAEDGGFYAVPPVAGTPLKIGDHRFAPAADPDGPRAASAEEMDAILALARHRIRTLESYRILSGGACWYDVEPQERFLVEAIGARAWAMSGFSGHGFKFGPLLGLALARAVRDPSLAAMLPPWAAGEAPPPPGLLDNLLQDRTA